MHLPTLSSMVEPTGSALDAREEQASMGTECTAEERAAGDAPAAKRPRGLVSTDEELSRDSKGELAA